MEGISFKWPKQGELGRILVEKLHWSKVDRRLFCGLQLYVTSGNTCLKLVAEDDDVDDVTQSHVEERLCPHEEADTRLILHATLRRGRAMKL